MSVETNQFIRQLIEPDPSKRLTAGLALETMLSIISRRCAQYDLLKVLILISVLLFSSDHSH